MDILKFLGPLCFSLLNTLPWVSSSLLLVSSPTSWRKSLREAIVVDPITSIAPQMISLSPSYKFLPSCQSWFRKGYLPSETKRTFAAGLLGKVFSLLGEKHSLDVTFLRSLLSGNVAKSGCVLDLLHWCAPS